MPPLHRLVAVMALAWLAGSTARAQAPTAASQSEDFVKVAGDRFVVDGKPFVFVGANVEALQGELGRARYRDTLGAVAADGLRVARVWAFGEGESDASDWHRREVLFRAGPDGFLEAAYQHLDRVLAEARARNLRLIVTLGNNWSDYGGIPMYLRWAGLPPGAGPDDPLREAFYSDEIVRASFRAGIARLLDRTSSVTGVRYADDPTIFSWELMNESTVLTPAGAESRRAWITEMARFIRARDPHHLLAAGLMGYGSRDTRAEWIRVHRLPEIDYCDSHLYPDGTDAVALSPRARASDAEKRLFDFLDDRAQLARFVVGKPLVLGEFGFRTDGKPMKKTKRRGAIRSVASANRLRAGLLGQPRQRWFRRLLERFFHDGGAGALVWIYQPWTGKARDFGIYVDRPDTDDVRAVLRSFAEVAAAAPPPRNERLGPATGERLLYEPFAAVRARPRPHRRAALTRGD